MWDAKFNSQVSQDEKHEVGKAEKLHHNASSGNSSPAETQGTQTDNSSDNSEDETVNEGNWFEEIHKIRRHSDNELYETEKQAAKQRYTTAVAGVTTKPTGHTYKNTAYKKREVRKRSLENFQLRPTVLKQPKRYSPGVARKLSLDRISSSQTRASGFTRASGPEFILAETVKIRFLSKI